MSLISRGCGQWGFETFTFASLVIKVTIVSDFQHMGVGGVQSVRAGVLSGDQSDQCL